MPLHHWVRQAHRWLSVAFMAGFVVNVFALAGGEAAPVWLYLLVLIPLFLLMPTGVFMFALPYLSRRRGGRRAQAQAAS